LNFSRSTSEMDLIARRVIREMEGCEYPDLTPYADPDSDQYQEMVRRIGEEQDFTTLEYMRLDDLIASVGIDPGKLCTYCWNGKE